MHGTRVRHGPFLAKRALRGKTQRPTLGTPKRGAVDHDRGAHLQVHDQPQRPRLARQRPRRHRAQRRLCPAFARDAPSTQTRGALADSDESSFHGDTSQMPWLLRGDGAGCVVARHGHLARENRAQWLVFVAFGSWARCPCHFMVKTIISRIIILAMRPRTCFSSSMKTRWCMSKRYSHRLP